LSESLIFWQEKTYFRIKYNCKKERARKRKRIGERGKEQRTISNVTMATMKV